MIVSEAISQVKNALRLVHADRRITGRYIYSLLQKHAALFIKRESDKLQLIKVDNIWQTLSCFPTIEVPITDPCCKFTSKCKIVRTKDKLPETFEDSWGILLKHVSSIDNTQDMFPIKMSEWTRKLDNVNFKYDKTYYYFFRDGYLYLPNVSWKEVSITGMFLYDVSHLNNCDPEYVKEQQCISQLERPWRIPNHLKPIVIESVLKELTSTLMNINPSPETNINKNEQ